MSLKSIAVCTQTASKQQEIRPHEAHRKQRFNSKISVCQNNTFVSFCSNKRNIRLKEKLENNK
jgi:hypothetical protein